MLDALRNFIMRRRSAPSPSAASPSPRDEAQLAAAALLLEPAYADGDQLDIGQRTLLAEVMGGVVLADPRTLRCQEQGRISMTKPKPRSRRRFESSRLPRRTGVSRVRRRPELPRPDRQEHPEALPET